jgi:hypothetical protein
MVPTSLRSGMLTHRSPFDPGGGFRLPVATDPVRLPSCETNIGTVVFLTHKKERAEAILDAAGKWRCPELPVLDRVLNALHEPKRDARRDMPFGYAELIRVAAWLKGEVRQPAKSWSPTLAQVSAPSGGSIL